MVASCLDQNEPILVCEGCCHRSLWRESRSSSCASVVSESTGGSGRGCGLSVSGWTSATAHHGERAGHGTERGGEGASNRRSDRSTKMSGDELKLRGTEGEVLELERLFECAGNLVFEAQLTWDWEGP